MSDNSSKAQRIVDAILGGERFANSRTFADRVYSDEPILRTGARAYANRSKDSSGNERVASRAAEARRQRASVDSSSMQRQLDFGTFDFGTISPYKTESRSPSMPSRARSDNVLPKRYEEVRRAADEHRRHVRQYGYGVGGARLFAEQARLLAGIEDDYDSAPDPFAVRGNLPTYEDLSNHDLRCYVSWRTRLRGGETLTAPLWCVLLHAFEIIGGFGVEPGIKAYEALLKLGLAYAKDTSLEQRFALWAHDYVIYHDMDVMLLEQRPVSSAVQSVSVLRRAEEGLLGATKTEWPDKPNEKLPTSFELLDALVCLSRYRADKSRFFRIHREDVAWVTCRVFADMVAHCSKRRKTGLVDGLFGSPTRLSYTMFSAALIWPDEPHEDAEYVVGPGERYMCERGFWWRVLPCRRVTRSKELGALLHAIDARMRRAMGDKHDLKDRPLPKYQAKFVDARIAELVELQAAEEAARIVIDRSALTSIRSSSVRTRDALLTEDDLADDDPKIAGISMPAGASGAMLDHKPADVTASGVMPVPAMAPVPLEVSAPTVAGAGLGLSLSGEQLEILTALLNGEAPPANEMFVTLAVDAINEAFLDIVGDTVIEYEGETPVLVEDYTEDVRAALS